MTIPTESTDGWRIFVLMMLCHCVGCLSRPQLNTDYGKTTSLTGSASINGTRVFAEMFRQQGVTVNRQRIISPKLDRFQTIVWFPDRHEPPSDEVVQALNNWLNQDFQRTLIYVGRHYEADLHYLSQLREQDLAEKNHQEELYRRIAEATVGKQIEKKLSSRSADVGASDCAWFRKSRLPRRNTGKIAGELAAGVDASLAELELGTVLLPPVGDEDIEPRELLTAGEVPFVFAIEGLESLSGQVIIVSNGSFLLNYALTNPAHRQLARNLMDQCDLAGAVAFLESGPGEVAIRNRLDSHQPWAWISRPPLRYVVPHVIAWGVLYCFVFFPIFGRAKRFRVKSLQTQPGTASSATSTEEPSEGERWSIHQPTNTTSFRSHITALGKLLQRSETTTAAKEKIQRYLESFGRESANK